MTIQTPATFTGDGTAKSLSTWLGFTGGRGVWFQLTPETSTAACRVGGVNTSSAIGIPFGAAFSSAQFVPQASQPYNAYDFDNIYLYIPLNDTVSMGYGN